MADDKKIEENSNQWEETGNEAEATEVANQGGEESKISSDQLNKDVLTESFGASGTKIFNGIIQEDYNSKLQGQQGMAIYDTMRRSDATVSASSLAIQLPIRSTRRYMEAVKS